MAPPSAPRDINPANWGGMPFTTVDAAVNWGNGTAYIFSGTKYVAYNMSNDTTSAPRDINPANWGGMPFTTVDAAVNWGNGTVYIFSGNNYVSYDIASDVASEARSIKGNWPGVVWR